MLHFLPLTSVLLDAREPPFMSVPLLNWNCAVVLALPAGDSLPAKEKGAAPVENGEAPELAPILNPGPFLLNSEDWPNAEPLPRMSMTLPDLSWAAGPIPTLGLDTTGAVTTHTIQQNETKIFLCFNNSIVWGIKLVKKVCCHYVQEHLQFVVPIGLILKFLVSLYLPGSAGAGCLILGFVLALGDENVKPWDEESMSWLAGGSTLREETELVLSFTSSGWLNWKAWQDKQRTQWCFNYLPGMWILFENYLKASGHKGAAVLLPGFAIKW